MGDKSILPLSASRLPPGGKCQYPPEDKVWKNGDQPGKDQVTLFASDQEFPPGELLHADERSRGPGYQLADRVVHRFYDLGPAEKGVASDPGKSVVKKTINVVTK